MDKVLKIGIIGCGGIANGKHMPALKTVKDVEMVAFCDIVLERAEKAAKEYGTPDAKVYEDYKELLKDESILLLEEETGEIVSGERHNLVFKKTKLTEKVYPRRNAQIMKNPL